MDRRITFVRTASVAILLAAAWADAAPPPEIVRRLDAAALDMNRGRPADAHEKLQPLLERDDPALHREMEAHLKKKKVEGALGDVVAKLRIDIASGRGEAAKALRPMGPAEAACVRAAVAGRLQSLLEPVDKELGIRFRVDASLEALQEQLRRCNSLLDTMEVVQRLHSLHVAACKHAGPQRQQEAKKDDLRLLERVNQLIARVVEVSLTVIPDQLNVVQDDATPYADRATAVAQLEDAFAAAKRYFPRYKAAKKGKGPVAGNAGDVFAALKRNEQEFDRAAGGLRLKMYHLEQGKIWWLRGRWGVGAYHEGLTKGVAGRAMVADYFIAQLMMPDPIPKPVDPLRDPRPLPWARRHLEVWKAGYPAGPAFQRAERNRAIGKFAWRVDPPPAGLQRVNPARVVESDENFNPFVGYLEYQMALYHWGQLLALAGAAEMAGIDKAIGDDERFAVPSYLSRQYDHVEPESTLRLTVAKSDDPRVTDAYERRGLAWCIALAQIELGGIRATYSGLEYEPAPGSGDPGEPGGGWRAGNSGRLRRPVRPFDRLVMTPFTRRAVHEVLWDGMRQQYYRVRTEVIIETGRISAPSEFMAPVVRLAVALEFIRGYRKHFGETLKPAQLAELARWQRELEMALNQLSVAWTNNLKAGVEAWSDPVRRPRR